MVDRPEIVLFGNDLRLRGPVMYLGPNGLTIRSIENRKVRITRFVSKGDDQFAECDADLKEVISTMVDLGSSYGEVIRTLYALRTEEFLDARVEVNAIPRSDRKYLGNSDAHDSFDATGEADWGDDDDDEEEDDDEDEDEDDDDNEAFSSSDKLIPAFD
jgi:hypothetical protein